MADRAAASRIVDDMMDPARAEALHVSLGLEGPPPLPAAPLPPFFHQVYFWDPAPPGRLGPDGHPRLGTFIPDLGLPRRMWAGGRVAFHGPLVTARPATRKSVIEKVERKEGRSGPLGFVTIRHEIRQGGAIALIEWQTLVYRPPRATGARAPAPPVAPQDEAARRSRSFSATDLFRYSALTLNGHRIHYDAAYATEVEGYSGLVVHGPLIAQMLMLMAQELLETLHDFRFRATAPLFVEEAIDFCARATAEGLTLWARGPDGRLAMQAEAR